jgi:hypothetical protein
LKAVLVGGELEPEMRNFQLSPCRHIECLRLIQHSRDSRLDRQALKHTDIGATRIANRGNPNCGSQRAENNANRLTPNLRSAMTFVSDLKHQPVRPDMGRYMTLPNYMGVFRMPECLI